MRTAVVLLIDEGLRTDSRSNDYIRVYGRGFVQVPFDALWQAAQAPEHNYDALVATAHGNPIPPCP